MRDLSRLLRPRSIAVVGGAWAANVVEQCLRMGYSGAIWPVNPNRAEIHGVGCFRSLRDLPGAPDAAFIGVNRHAAIEAVRELAAMGAGGAVCFASGFAEAGEAGLQAAFVEAAGAMPVLGPNCYGIINYVEGAPLWPDQHGGRRVEKGVALLSQSSNIVINLTMQTRGLPIAYVVCLGNQAQTGLAEVARALVADQAVTALGLYVEGLDDAREFAAAAEAARAADKPVVVLKAGRTAASRTAILSHTASLAGEGAASSAFFRACGVAEVATLTELLEVLKIAHLHGSLPGNRIGSLSCSGGEAGLIADLAEGLPLQWPQQSEGVARAMGEVLGPIVAIRNPMDYHTFIWGDQARMQAVFSAMMRGPYDLTMLVMDYPHATRCSAAAWESTAAAFRGAVAETGARAAVAVTLPENMPEAEADAWMDCGIVPLHGLEEALTALSVAAHWPDSRPGWRPLAPVAGGEAVLLDEAEAKALLAEAGVAVPEGLIAAGIAGAAEVASALGGALVLKGLGFAHKSEAGAVRLGLSAGEVAVAAPMEGAAGYLIERMVEGAVAELLVGFRRDPVYGVTLTLGLGGVQAELLRDTVTLVLPVTAEEVGEALGRLRLAPLLQGYRGRPTADIAAAVAAIMVMAGLIERDPAIEEIEVNPLMLKEEGEGAVAADALVRRREP
ncbi:MAG TPA: acetate--CoA ligase family protein [Paracoccaceae bacterium]|nr:acetate--CoA ligase family protein [Paracoccaceae bacterium]